MSFIDGDSFKLLSRNQLDITFKYPELHPLADALKGHRAILDGEIVALDDVGRPRFSRLTNRMQVTSPAAVHRVIDAYPVWYVLFDVLWIDGQWITGRPLRERHRLLKGLTIEGPSWQTSPAHIGEGANMLDTARRHGLEGIVAKRLNSIYTPGQRSRDWIKIKIVHGQEFVIGGWVPEGSDVVGRVGSMLLGYYDCDRRLHYAGRVGTGLNASWHAKLFKQFSKLTIDTSPFADRVPSRGVRFLNPKLVAEIEFRRWPEGGLVQQGSFKGLRTDKKASHVVKEIVQAPSS